VLDEDGAYPGFEDVVGSAGKKMSGKKCRDQDEPSFTAHFSADLKVSGSL
jgi:hypothetical protein